MWKRDPRSPLIKSGPPGSCDSAMASDPKVFYDSEQEVPFHCFGVVVLLFNVHVSLSRIFWRWRSHQPVCLSTLTKVWVMFYFGVGKGTGGHADILIAFSKDLIHWDKDETPLYRAGGHPDGIDAQHAHKISIIYDDNGVGYLYYTAVGPKGRGIALLTSKPVA